MLHEQLVDVQVNTEDVLNQRQYTDQQDDGRGYFSNAWPGPGKPEQSKPTQRETECSVVLHGDKGRVDLNECWFMQIPAQQNNCAKYQRQEACESGQVTPPVHIQHLIFHAHDNTSMTVRFL
jgi:hypothetical protein